MGEQIGFAFCDSKNREKFRGFHRDNPKVWELFRKFAFQAIESGRPRYGANSVIERIRWHTNIETNDPEFKINNNHAPYYARMFMEVYPEHDEFFITREVKDE
jgi:hypothetical protein